MAYAYGMRFDDDSNAITVIDEENQTAITTGYINGEPVDFSGGGGGSSDFSIAEVTFTAVGGFNDVVFGIPSISDNKLTTQIEITLDDGESMTVEVPLYKGYCICDSPMTVFSNATGSVSIGEMNVLTITGDGGVSIALTD